MPYTPNRDEFRRLAESHDRVPVYRQLMCDGLTPVSTFQRIDDGQTACLFESVIGGEKVGRYSFLAIQPEFEIQAIRDQVTTRYIERNEQGNEVSSRTERLSVDNPLDEVRKRLGSLKVAKLADQPPFTGGAVGYASYDVVRYVENLPNAPADDRQLPDALFSFYESMIVFDHVSKTMTIFSLADTTSIKNLAEKDQTKSKPPNQTDDACDAAFEKATQRIDALIERIRAGTSPLDIADIQTGGEPDITYESNFSKSHFEAAVKKCVQYIEAGDIFQVVLSQRLKVPRKVEPFEVYRTLRVVNPSPFMFFLRNQATTLVGSSPEIMCRVVDGEVTVRPLAGTRKRGKTEAEDRALEEELLADPKERAEHVMLVDLGRNDVGRVAQFGSVQLPDVMVVERYSHVMHISSTVTGQLRDEFDAFDALAASLPAGTVSGAPKVRAMEIIDELEPHRRGPYAGAVGYVDFGGNMDTCIALRTMVFDEEAVYVQAGAGIVADSDSEAEYQETLNKARGLLKAIEITERRCQSQ